MRSTRFCPIRRALLGLLPATVLLRRSMRAWAAGDGAGPSTSTVVDIHCHVFNGSDLPITGFLAHYIPGLSDLSRELTGVPETIVRKIVGFVHKELVNRVTPGLNGETDFLSKVKQGDIVPPVARLEYPPDALKVLADEIASVPFLHLDSNTVRITLDRVAQLLFLVSHERARVAATMATVYPEVSLFTPLLVDYDAWSDDKPATPLVDQIDAHAAVSRASTAGLIGREGARFHPFVAFDPLRETRFKMKGASQYRPFGDARVFAPGARYECPPLGTSAPTRPGADAGAIELVRYAIETAGFIGCKVYPSVGFAPLDNEHLNADPETGKQLDLALRAFYAYCQAEEIPVTTHTSPGNEYALGFRNFASPAPWMPVLREFPRLRLNLGHFGHETGVDPAAGVSACTAWIRQAASLMNVYPNVYADMSNSALVYDEAYATKFLGHLDEIFTRFPKARKRVMYGSDYWLNHLSPGADDFVREFHKKLDKKFDPLTRADIMGTTALRFLGLLDDEGNKPPAGRNRRRLRRFYGSTPKPSWLGDA